MELNYKTIKQLEPEDIFKIILPIVDDIYKKIYYIEIPKDEFYNLVLDEISTSKEPYTGDISYEEYIKNKINLSLSEQSKKYFTEKEKSYIAINNYINNSLNLGITEDDTIKELKKLEKFCLKNNYTLSPDITLEIIKNNQKLVEMIEMIIGKNKKEIKNTLLDKMPNDSILVSIIESYCLLNGIEIDESQTDIETYYEGNSVKLYLKEISKRPLLSPSEEKELAIRISNGDEEAKKIFIESNLKLVVHIAKNYIGRGLSFLDLIQEGNIGLMIAVDKYDVNRNIKFSSYAFYWIRHSIQRAIEDKARNIRVPVYKNDEIYDYRKVIGSLEEKLNKEPTIEEIAQEMNITVSKAKKLYRLQNDTISLNKLVNHDDDTELESILKTSDYMNPEKLAVAKTMREQVRKELENSSLSEREKEVLILRFGLYDQEPLTQTEIAKKFDVSRGAISQIKQRALKKLGNSKNIKILAMYMISSEKAVEQLKELDKKSLKKNKEDNISIEKGENLKMSRKTSRKLKTLYEFFKGYSKEEVDSELEKLTEEEKRIIVARFGENLNVLIPDSLDMEQKNKFYRTIVPRIKRHLSEQKVTKELETNEKIKETYSNNTETEEENSTLIDIPSVDNKDVSLEEPIFLNQKETPIIKTSNEETNYVGNSVIEKNSSKQEEIITKDDYIKLLELLKTPMFNQITGTLTNKELVIISLKLGYIDGKYFSNESIAEFLGIEKDEIIETTKKILLLYKERLNELIDNAIEVVTEKPSTLTRKLKNI